MKLKVLVVQNNPIIGNKNATLNNVDALLSRYKNNTFDIIVLPEVFAIGWDCKNFQKKSEIIETSDTINYLKNIAIEFNALIIGGSFIQKTKENTYKNTCPIISPKGNVVSTYDKLHLFSHKDSEEDKYLTTGEELKLINYKNTKIGITICYDIRFPEIYRAYSKQGAEILINVAAWSKTKPEHWSIMHRARAIENQCIMIAANQTGKFPPNGTNLGQSMITDAWGNIIGILDEQEDCLSCEIDTNEVKELRNNFPLISNRKDNFEYFKIKEININE